MKNNSVHPDPRIGYAEQITDPWRWLNSAQILFKTSELIEPQIHSLWNFVENDSVNEFKNSAGKVIEVADYQSVYMMLIAYSIENLLKGRIIECERDKVHRETLKTGKLPTEVKSHNLSALAKKCNLKLTDIEQKLLHRLSEHAMWFGRYPFPTSVPDHYIFRKPFGPTIDTGWSLEQAKAVKILAESISKQLGKKLK